MKTILTIIFKLSKKYGKYLIAPLFRILSPYLEKKFNKIFAPKLKPEISKPITKPEPEPISIFKPNKSKLYNKNNRATTRGRKNQYIGSKLIRHGQ
jgi:hypothetical protein